MSKWGEDRVLVEVYIRGKGPVHKLKLPWEGYEKNQVDLESLMRKCRLNAIYAFSLTQGRGVEQFYNPKNGLSLITYSGKPDSIIRYDGEPKPTVATVLSRYALAFVLVSLLLISSSRSKNEWVVQAQQLLGGRATWIACFVIMIFSHLARRSLRRK
ncbi:hypothetical protein M758_6G024900 [Ceratodon purpureus]|uniref:Uncharacterized protein n=1 Tax=Ceratodon purpureus TaxID=3225 RepID=A0A8T0HB99_CERPU|nr:hypothetical protein KC19_6G027800 [Ceratodon purpureus]KAG0612406.1 hypothetical protein M758_6G024900 [Ceratodon purpureus]